MASKLLRLSLPKPLALHPTVRAFTTSPRRCILVTSDLLSQITAAEKKITKDYSPAKDGPTARAQAHVGSELTRQVIHDITEGEKTITGRDGPIQGGPTSIVQSILTAQNTSTTQGGTSTSPDTTLNSSNQNQSQNQSPQNEQPTGTLNSSTLSKITAAEKKLTGKDSAVKNGPTAQAQKHANEPITSQALHDITEGEKKVTGGKRVKGGPTSAAQSELAKSRS